jgi:glycosyltransferase involved in cell wall biosynthesis
MGKMIEKIHHAKGVLRTQTLLTIPPPVRTKSMMPSVSEEGAECVRHFEPGMNEAPKISIIIPCYNGADTIGHQLEAIGRQQSSWPCEVIVSDNGSTDGSIDVVKRLCGAFPGLIRIVDSSDRKGVAHARNAGALAAAGQYLAFVDQDDEVGDGWLLALGDALSRHDLVGCAIDFQKLNEPWLQKIRGGGQSHGLSSRAQYGPGLPWAMACTIGVKRSIHFAVGGWDERFVGGEDYCWRIQLAGTPLYFAREAVLHYRYRTTIRELWRQARLYGADEVMIYKKWGWKHSSLLSLAGWITHLLRFPRSVWSRIAFGKWMWLTGYKIGCLEGSIKYRVVYI